jgi:hypothetical protein
VDECLFSQPEDIPYRVWERSALRRTFKPKRKDVAEVAENCIINSVIFSTVHEKLLR